MKKIDNFNITFFRIGNKYNLPQYVKLDMTGNVVAKRCQLVYTILSMCEHIEKFV